MTLVPTLRVGMLFGRSAAFFEAYRHRAGTVEDAERPKTHSHAERGNEGKSAKTLPWQHIVIFTKKDAKK